MQLNTEGSEKQERNVRLALTAATSLLLGTADAQAGDWKFDTQVLYYSETDRVTAIEPVISARWDRGEGQAFSLRLTVDSLTGASASGATPSSRPQTFTTPSGHSTYDVQAGETPLDPSFLDTRFALAAVWEKSLGSVWKATLGTNVSTEYDYLSVALNGNLARDFNQHNTTLAMGLSLGYDSIEPVGGIPRALAQQSPEVSGAPRNRVGADDDKTVYDLLVGVTQVIDPRSLVQINYGIGQTSGYLTDPYKLVSVIDPRPGPTQGDPVDQLYESRPDSRTKQNLFVAYKRQTSWKDVVDVNYRYSWDDWGIRSNTVDLRYRWDFEEVWYLQPHLRYYQQSAADFYQRFLIAGEPLPSHASADYRLGDLTGLTFGLKYGRPLAKEREWNVKVEYYQQSGDEPTFQPGSLANVDLFPDVKAVVVQFGFSF